ncbi:hypothetical protein J1N35_014738 [Gossypium stocksii]|uniref:Uncharacterized protein n=1 Tax=Gossypium stocksii TaxID=47602 RepID=A0A9D3VUT8_9ROSI|nr:hypothetical protein J1N35_014738 [Gossypium stocksii]
MDDEIDDDSSWNKEYLITNIKLKPCLNESVKEPIHFLAKIEKVPTKGIDVFISSLFDDEDKAQVNRTSRHMEVKWLEDEEGLDVAKRRQL